MRRWRDRASTACGLVAAVFLTAMMLLTVADVALRAAFNFPIRGVYELIELLLAWTFFLALVALSEMLRKPAFASCRRRPRATARSSRAASC